MSFKIKEDDLYPFFHILSEEDYSEVWWNRVVGGREIDVEEEFLERYNKIMDEFYKIQEELEELHRGK